MSRTLVIGNKNYSSWSLRPWLAMSHAGIAFEERRIPLSQPQTRQQLNAISPSGRVPCLIDDGEVIWDSLAICEYAAELVEPGVLWPEDGLTRARARSAAAEMHSGFSELRTHMPMDIRSHHTERGAAARKREPVADDIARICALWTDCLAASGGPFLFGRFSIADAFFAPVVTRFETYGVPLRAQLAAYSDCIFELPAMQQWVEQATAEVEIIEYR